MAVDATDPGRFENPTENPLGAATNTAAATDSTATAGPPAAIRQTTPAPADPRSASYFDQLSANEHLWKWKAALRLLLCIVTIIGIGAAGYLVDSAGNFPGSNYAYYGGLGAGIVNAWALIPLGISFLFCLVCLLVLFLRRPPRPAHPGIAVGVDLVLWLGFLAVALLTLGFAILQFAGYADGGDSVGDFGDYHSGYEGQYVKAPNGTYVYNITTTASEDYYNATLGYYTSTPVNASSIVRDCTPQFASCAAQDEAVNDFLHHRRTIFNVAVLLDTVLFLCVLLHFVLFVWACVDTSRYRSGKNRREFEAAVEAAMTRHYSQVPPPRTE